ncbi:MAG: hypothetical protein WCY72_01545 [Lysobacteraceae bacterium]
MLYPFVWQPGTESTKSSTFASNSHENATGHFRPRKFRHDHPWHTGLWTRLLCRAGDHFFSGSADDQCRDFLGVTGPGSGTFTYDSVPSSDRNLKTREVGLATFGCLFSRMVDAAVNVVASGIVTPADASRLASEEADVALVLHDYPCGTVAVRVRVVSP